MLVSLFLVDKHFIPWCFAFFFFLVIRFTVVSSVTAQTCLFLVADFLISFACLESLNESKIAKRLTLV